MIKTKGILSQKKLTRYAKLKLGYDCAHNVSLYDFVCKALEVDGKPKPDGVDPKKWVINNISLIPEIKKPIELNPTFLKPVVKKTTYKTAFESTKEFLLTYEWRKTRMLALKKYGSRCQCCGATPASGAIMNVDHIKPRKLFPSLALDVNNLQILCHECNHGKGNWDMTDWRK